MKLLLLTLLNNYYKNQEIHCTRRT